MNRHIFFILLFFPIQLFAQEADTLVVEEESRYDIIQELQTPLDNGGEVTLDSDSHIDNLLQWRIHLNEKNKTFTGYRIQIHSVSSFGCDIDKLKEIRNQFEETFLTIPAYLNYFDPDFKIRVGNYRNRLECIPDLHLIRKKYPGSYAVKTNISLDELRRIPMQDIPSEISPEKVD